MKIMPMNDNYMNQNIQKNRKQKNQNFGYILTIRTQEDEIFLNQCKRKSCKNAIHLRSVLKKNPELLTWFENLQETFKSVCNNTEIYAVTSMLPKKDKKGNMLHNNKGIDLVIRNGFYKENDKYVGSLNIDSSEEKIQQVLKNVESYL